MENFTIEFYRKEDGSCPITAFLDSLDNKLRAKTLRMIMLLQINGNELREPYSKSLGDGIFELRTKFGSDVTRVLYFFVMERKIILTNGFVKKTQKTPKQEIELSKKYRNEYLNRIERGISDE